MTGSDDGSTGPGADGDLIVVSNREPYTHHYTAEGTTHSQPSGGLVSALDAVMAGLGGTWIAWRSGDADFDPAVLEGDGAGASSVLVLSEFAGAAADLGAVEVNPFDTATFADRLAGAVEMDERERHDRFGRLTETVRSAGIDEWVEANVRRL